jgi:hypothetical protein
MKKLQETNKITLASLKAFAKRNEGHLYIKTKSSFDGMSDMVEQNKEAQWHKAITEKLFSIEGIWTVGGSRDYFRIYDNGDYFGLEVSNCCGSQILAIKL